MAHLHDKHLFLRYTASLRINMELVAVHVVMEISYLPKQPVRVEFF